MSDFYKEKSAKNIEQMEEIIEDFPQYAKAFCRDQAVRGHSSNTSLGYARDVRCFLTFLLRANPSFKDRPISSIPISYLECLSYFDLQEYLADIQTYTDFKGRTFESSEKTIARKVTVVKQFYDFLQNKAGLIKTNPASGLSIPKLHKKNVVYLEAEEARKLLYAVESGYYLTDREKKHSEHTRLRDTAVIYLLLHSGIRVSECVGIDIKDLDLKNHRVRLTRKGGDENWGYFNKETAEKIKLYIDVERKEESGSEGALFLSRLGKRLTVRSVQKLVKKYTRGLGLNKEITPHKMRSTCGTNLYRETRDIYLVADMLGHSGLGSVQKYVEAGVEKRKTAADSFKY